MSDRYTKLYELPGSLYAAGSPVLVCAGALLRDERSKALVCQFRFRNLDVRVVRGITVVLRMTDEAGRPIGEPITRSYLDLEARQDADFGQNVALRVPYRNARAFSVRVAEVLFAEKSRWQDMKRPWETVPHQQLLRDAYGDEELAAQFRIRYGTDCLYAPLDAGEIWYCTCGAVNRREEKSCHHCRRVCETLLAVKTSSLRLERDARLESEEEKRRERESASERPERGGFRRPILLLLLSLLLLAAVIYFTPRLLDRIVPLPIIPASESSEPAEPAEEIPAETTPAPTPTPSPEPTPVPTLSPEELRQVNYEAASTLLSSGSYSAARSAFLAMGDYQNSEEMAQEAVYRKAMALYSFIEQYDEKDIYAALSMDPNVTNRFSLSSQKALTLGSTVVDALRAACGGDFVDLTLEDAPSEGLRPLANCVKDLFSYLGSYRDSAERLASLDVMTDYTKDFYMLCQAGDIYGAYDWLQRYTGDFPGREHWLQLLDLYKPYCDEWRFSSGDPTLLSYIGGSEFSCMTCSSRVLIDGDRATLRVLIRYTDSELIVDFYAETGTLGFSTSDGTHFFLTAVTNVDHLAVMKYINDVLKGGAEYERAY